VFFADWPLLLMPVHIAFFQLTIDPACTLVFEAEKAEADVMRGPPPKRDVGDLPDPLLSLGTDLLCAPCLEVVKHVRRRATRHA